MECEVVEAALEAVACLIKCGYKKEDTGLFRKIQDFCSLGA